VTKKSRAGNKNLKLRWEFLTTSQSQALPYYLMAVTSAALYLLLAVIPSLILTTIYRSYRVSPLSKSNQWITKHGAARFPGPRQFPIIGRVYDLPRTASWLKFKAWTDEYGPVYETSMMGQRFIVVSDEGIATDLLVKMGNHFGGRPQIRALIDHKKGPTYLALQDRNGMFRPFPQGVLHGRRDDMLMVEAHDRDMEGTEKVGSRRHGRGDAKRLLRPRRR